MRTSVLKSLALNLDSPSSRTESILDSVSGIAEFFFGNFWLLGYVHDDEV
ncbi:MAG: hypothetical protein V7L27_19150 [Nostoc sp.]